MATYEFFRLNLQKWEKEDPFNLGLNIEVDRKFFLKSMFYSKIEFLHYNNMFTYVPFPEISEKTGIITGGIGKKVTDILSDSPDTNFAPKSESGWEVSNFFLYLNEGQFIQTVSIQDRNEVGSPESLLKALIHAVMGDKWKPYKIDYEPISNVKDFWDIVNSNQNNISEIFFSFLPPNSLWSNETFKEDLRVAKEKNNAKKVNLSLKNDEKKLKIEGDDIEDMVNLATSGGGEVQLKSGNEVLYSSSQNRKKESVDDNTTVGHSDDNSIFNLIRKIFRSLS